MKQLFNLLLVLLIPGFQLFAQNVGINTNTPHPSSELEIASTTKGFLAPRMTLDQRNAIESPATGLLIYQTNETPGFYVFNGTEWTGVGGSSAFFKSDASKISYNNLTDLGKNFIVNSNQINFDPDAADPDFKLMYLPSIYGAFRVGAVDNDSWDEDNIGKLSFATGLSTIASGDGAFATGNKTQATGDVSTAFGANTTASGSMATAFGSNTHSIGLLTFTAGENTTALGNASTALGVNSAALGHYAFVSGVNSEASGHFSIAMGYKAQASGHYSSAFGSQVSTDMLNGSFIIGDYQETPTTYSSEENEMTMRFSGGYRLFTNPTATVGVILEGGANSWAIISDSTKKENFLPAPEVLSKIAAMKLGSWNYKSQDKNTRHYGPLAQEFYNNFGKDEIGTIGNDKTIGSADMDGIMMIAIQQLIKENENLKKENEIFKNTLNQQSEELKVQREMVQSELESIRKENQALSNVLSRIEALYPELTLVKK